MFGCETLAVMLICIGDGMRDSLITVVTDNNIRTTTIVTVVSAPEGLDNKTVEYRTNKIVKLVKKLSK